MPGEAGADPGRVLEGGHEGARVDRLAPRRVPPAVAVHRDQLGAAADEAEGAVEVLVAQVVGGVAEDHRGGAGVVGVGAPRAPAADGRRTRAARLDGSARRPAAPDTCAARRRPSPRARSRSARRDRAAPAARSAPPGLAVRRETFVATRYGMPRSSRRAERLGGAGQGGAAHDEDAVGVEDEGPDAAQRVPQPGSVDGSSPSVPRSRSSERPGARPAPVARRHSPPARRPQVRRRPRRPSGEPDDEDRCRARSPARAHERRLDDEARSRSRRSGSPSRWRSPSPAAGWRRAPARPRSSARTCGSCTSRWWSRVEARR